MSSEVKRTACAAIDAAAGEMAALAGSIPPELGYREARTASIIENALRGQGVSGLHTVGLTGRKGWLLAGSPLPGTPKVALLAELDAVLCPAHPDADAATGAAHACGHSAQLAVLAGCAAGLAAVRGALPADVCLLAAPAEEYLELEYRQGLIEQGKLGWPGGKQQLIAEGAFDDVDIAMMVHADCHPTPRICVGSAGNGFIGKQVRFTGREAHAGGAPWNGVNALNAAMLALNAIHALRETFRDEDHVRVHPILTKGGDGVNTVPADVRMESYVRAASVAAMRAANCRVNRAIDGAAWALEAKVDILDAPGYLPLAQNPMLGEVFAQNAAALAPEVPVLRGQPFPGSTDMGDLAWLLPAIQPTVSGFGGSLHGADFCVLDEALAYTLPAKLLVCTLLDLLENGGERAKAIRAAQPRRTREEYARHWQGILQREAAL